MAPIFTGNKFGFGRSAEVAGFSATGGTISQGSPATPAAGYTIHQFTTTGPSSFIVNGAPPTFSIDLLLVGGGASGFGGGGGGVVYHPNIPIINGSYVVTVGSGGDLVGCNNGSCSPAPNPSGQGGSSSFGPYTIPGGSINPGAQSTPVGNGGPGGGSGGANHDSQPRNADNGTPNSILGINYYWGGGGGGGGNNNPGGSGGLGGGGGGGSNNGSGGSGGGSALNSGTPGGRTGPSTPTSPGGDGGTNTGGGGGGGLGGSRGGPGIVIIRYLT